MIHRTLLPAAALWLGQGMLCQEALALMPPHVDRTVPAHGETLTGDTLVFHGYSLEYAEEQVEVVDLLTQRPVEFDAQLDCQWEGEDPPGHVGGTQLRCELKVTLKGLEVGHRYRARYLDTELEFGWEPPAPPPEAPAVPPDPAPAAPETADWGGALSSPPRSPLVVPVSSSLPRTLALALGLVPALAVPSTAHAERVAVVIGIGSYAKLDPSLALPQASEDARALAQALERDGGFDQVLPLYDALATRSAIRDLLLENLPGQLDAEDSLLVYFAGHGLGGDFGEPYLLPYDVDPADLEGTALAVAELGSSLRNSLRVGSLVMITDAVHDQQLDGLVLMGPNAKSWPDAADEFFSLSACSPKELPGATPFGRLLAEGVSGAADSETDGQVTAHELVRFLLDRMASEAPGAHPAESGSYNPGLVVATVSKGPADFGPPPPPEPRSAGPRRAVGAGLMGLGVGLVGGGVGFYLDGLGIQEQAKGDPVLTKRYERDQLLSPLLIGAGAVSLVTGGVLVVLPSPSGASVAWTGRF